MIETGKHDYHGNEHDYIAIDLSDQKHPNRVIYILEKKCTPLDKYLFSIEAKWTNPSYHPVMDMDENDFLEFAKEIDKFANKIIARRTIEQS